MLADDEGIVIDSMKFIIEKEFGEECEIDNMSTLTTDPDIDGIDTSVNPPIVRYSVGVKVSYLDNSKKIWMLLKNRDIFD